MNKITEIARAEVGYVESPPNSNKTKYGKWFGFDGVAWCGMFVSYCYHHAGFPLGNIGFSKGFAGCQTAYAYFLKTKEITMTPKEGDIVLFDWNGDKRFDHTGIFICDNGNGTFNSIEGNTSATNQSNGGQVQLRNRPFNMNTIFVHPKVLGK